MLYGSFKEANQNEIVIEDCSKKALVPFLRQIYGFYPSQFDAGTFEVFREVFELNQRFLIKAEVNNNNCKWLNSKLKRSEDPELILDLLCLAHKHKMKPLEKRAVAKVQKMMASSYQTGAEFLKTEKWKEVKIKLKRDDIKI